MMSSLMNRPSPPARWVLLDRHAWALVVALALPALIPTLMPGWFEGHDDLHIYRLIEYDRALRDGQVPPRWFPDISAGYGNPHPIYYAPLFYLTAETFHLAGLDVILSLKAAIVVFTLVAAVFMFFYARSFFGTPAAVVAAAAYTYAPYRMLDLYVREAFSECTVFAFLPALLLAWHNLRARGSRRDVICGALAMAAMSTSHTITTMLVPPLLVAYALLLSVRGRGPAGARRWRWLGRAALSAVVGCAIAGFFLVPAFLERNEINLTTYTSQYLQYHKHFVYPIQLLWWPWGFGMSLEGLKDQMSFRMGLGLIAGGIAAVLALPRLRRRDRVAAAHVMFFLGVTVVAIFLMLPISALVWDLLPPMKFVQFPWRFLMLTALSTSFLSGAAFFALATSPPAPARGKGAAPAQREPWGAALAVCAVFVAEAALGGTLGVKQRIPADRLGFVETPDTHVIDRGPGALREPLDTSLVRRHTLLWYDHLPPDVSFRGLNQSDLNRPKVEVESGVARVSDTEASSRVVRFRVDADAPSRMRINIYRFPGWTARVDGAPASLVELPRERRVIFFNVPAGRHEVSVAFERTSPRTLGDLMSLAGLAALGAVGLWPVSARIIGTGAGLSGLGAAARDHRSRQ